MNKSQGWEILQTPMGKDITALRISRISGDRLLGLTAKGIGTGMEVGRRVQEA